MINQSTLSHRALFSRICLTLTAIVMPGYALAAENPVGKSQAKGKPNFIIILTDDQGYQDVGCFGSPNIKTPRLDRMAEEGTMFTSYYSQPVCGPARAALMSGCYPTRVMRSGSIGSWALPTTEITIAEVLKKAGYTTACLGKWDISARKPLEAMLPTDQGFDSYFGTLGATDKGEVSFYENREQRGGTKDMGSLTGMYTDKAVAFIKAHKDVPFFLYLAENMPHTIIGASDAFRGKSKRGLYGDVIEEIDWNVGRILDTIKECGLDEKTYVVFTSDNGPWLIKKEMGGSALPLRNGKGSAWEGGYRVPCIMRAPGHIPAGKKCNELIASIDIMPTFARLAGAEVPTDRAIDGKDQSSLVSGQSEKSAREAFFYYVKDNLHAVRQGRWKLALPGRVKFYDYAKDEVTITSPELYDLVDDVSEKTNVADKHPDIVARLMKLANEAREDVGDFDKMGKTGRSRIE